MSTLNHASTAPTLDQLRKVAKRIKRSDGIAHHEALELAARQAGFESWHQATLKLHVDETVAHPDDGPLAAIRKAEAEHQIAKEAFRLSESLLRL